jgi:quercetin dioxygenase-like cupin family protein
VRNVYLAFFLFLLVSVSLSQDSPLPLEQEPHHHLVLKNDYVYVTHVTLAPGESTLYHAHAHDRAAIELSAATITRQKLGEAEEAPDTSRPGDVSAVNVGASPLTHRVKNVGSVQFDVIDVEFLQRPTQASSSSTATTVAENASARVYRWTLGPGATSPMHSHERPYLIISATPMNLKMAAPDGHSFTHEVAAGDLHWIDTKVTHSLSNLGSTEGRIVEVELK